MIKKIRLTLFAFSICLSAFAQDNVKELLKKSDVYYFKNSGELVSTKDSADFIRVIMPPDSSDLSLFIINDFYTNGARKMVARSHGANAYRLRLEGTSMEYFKNGTRKKLQNFINGLLRGDEIDYYPNGKLYFTGNYGKFGMLKRIECRDSTGSLLAENGHGTWIEYDDDFKWVIGRGQVSDSLKQGEWQGTLNESVKYTWLFKDGLVLSGTTYENGVPHPFTQAEIEPKPIGGMQKLYEYLGHNIHYPSIAKRGNVQGKVFISFIIEKDGRLTNIKILRGIGAGCDEEAVRVLKASPLWIPGYQNGLPVRVQYTMPISFTLQQIDIR